MAASVISAANRESAPCQAFRDSVPFTCELHAAEIVVEDREGDVIPRRNAVEKTACAAVGPDGAAKPALILVNDSEQVPQLGVRDRILRSVNPDRAEGLC